MIKAIERECKSGKGDFYDYKVELENLRKKNKDLTKNLKTK